MALVPVYRPDVDKLLDQLQVGENETLWNAIVDMLTMICENSADGTGRAYRIQSHRGDTTVWAVRVPCNDPHDWYILWDDDFDDEENAKVAVFYYIGPLPHGMARE